MAIQELRKLAHSFFRAAVEAADPTTAVREELESSPLPALAGGRHVLVAVGKAACAMTEEALRHIPAAALRDAVAVTNSENARCVPGCTVMAAGHPVPDIRGLRAAKEVRRRLLAAGPDDWILCLISGGGSALMPLPPPGISLEDKAKVNEILLSRGFDIFQANLVRQQISQIKGGGMARMAGPAKVRALVLSDVIGDDLRCIASGPVSAPLGSPLDAVRLLRDQGVWDVIPGRVRAYLDRAESAARMPPGNVEAKLIGSNRRSLEAICAMAPGWSPAIVSDRLCGDVRKAAKGIVGRMAASRRTGRELLIWGGETTVSLKGDGRGGRNQELALRVALRAQDIGGDWVFLSGGTDGRDGPTDAAGGIVDSGTVGRIAGSGEDALELLSNSDSYRALRVAGDLLVTGATGTNVADVQLFLREARVTRHGSAAQAAAGAP